MPTPATDRLPPTLPPPATPRMLARDDGPAYRAYAGPESRYHRLRREAAAKATRHPAGECSCCDGWTDACDYESEPASEIGGAK